MQTAFVVACIGATSLVACAHGARRSEPRPIEVRLVGHATDYHDPDTTVRELFQRDRRYRVNTITSEPLPAAGAERCAYGRARGADLLVWRESSRRNRHACVARRLSYGAPCTDLEGDNEVWMDVTYYVMDTATCTTRTAMSAHGHGRGGTDWEHDTFPRAESAAFVAVKRELTNAFDDAFSTGLRIVSSDGSTGTIAGDAQRRGDTLRVVRDGERVGDVVVSHVAERETRVMALTHDVQLRAGDRLEAGSRWCCIELALDTTVARGRVDEAPAWAFGGGLAVRWYEALSSPAFELHYQMVALGPGTVHVATAGAGYRQWVIPRHVALIGMIGGGFAIAEQRDPLDLRRPLSSGSGIGFARLGVELRLTDVLRIHAATHVDTGPDFDWWKDDQMADATGPRLTLSGWGGDLALALRY